MNKRPSKEELIRLLLIYDTQAEIARYLGVSKQLVNQWLKHYGLSVESSKQLRLKQIGKWFYLYKRDGDTYKLLGKFTQEDLE
jgi:transcriptional regulator with XRE-family HTH domain